MQYTRLRVWVLFTVIVVVLIMLFKWASGSRGIYESPNPITDSAITDFYPSLYDALYQRKAGQIKPFLSHQHDTVRAQAWRALAATSVDSLDQYINLAKKQNSDVAWFSISKHELNSKQLRSLESNWKDNPDYRTGIARVLGWQGDRKSLDFLLRKIDSDIATEYHYALALGRLVTRYKLSGEEQINILQAAFDVTEDSVEQAYLYGWYRGAKTPLTPTAKDTLMSRWQIQGMGLNTPVDQYVNKIFPERTTYTITNFYNGEQDLDHEVQLAVELARSLESLKMTDRNSLAAKILLTHTNPQVKRIALKSIEAKLSKGDDLYRYITRAMIPDTSRSEAVWLQALKTASAVDSSVISAHRERVERLVKKNPYLQRQALKLYRAVMTEREYLDHIQKTVQDTSSLAVIYAVQSLHDFWKEQRKQQRINQHKGQVRHIVFAALDQQDRGIAYTIKPLLEQEDLFNKKDFRRINRKLMSFSLPDDIEVFQQFGLLYKKRFEQQAGPFIDSLAALDYAPLNRSLADAGWKVNVPKESTEFRKPDWQRLWKLGAHPEWTLRTEKGNITIAMDPLRAPATVSAIDSLSRAGAYDGVPFHRVVPNFVIQGGDIERGDGFGGPRFVLPTEASELGYTRGSAGIASAGNETEGSQYFMMHQWSPHLNGNYTRFGRVVEGMDVVDRIEKGDLVHSTTWY